MYSLWSDERKSCRVRLLSGLRCALVLMFFGLGAAQAVALIVEEQKLTAAEPSGYDRFGSGIAVSGDTAVVGAFYNACAPDTACGSAYVYRFDGTSWIEEQTLTPSDLAEQDWFGHSVALSGNTALVASKGDDCTDGGDDCGAAYVFRFTGTSWVEEQKLTASNALARSRFGGSVSVSGNTALTSTSRLP